MVQSFSGAVTARTNAGQYPFMIAACESSTASLSVVFELVRANRGFVISNYLSPMMLLIIINFLFSVFSTFLSISTSYIV